MGPLTKVSFLPPSCSDIWAIGVITYFLLCGYTPFDRDSNFDEMQAIIRGDYSFPTEYWRGVSAVAQEFIRRCLTVDPKTRMTAAEALGHPWITDTPTKYGEDLLPTVKKNFNARRTLHAAIDTIRAINQLRAGGGGAAIMEGAFSNDPQRAGAGEGGGQGGQGAAPPVQPVMPVEEDVMEIDSHGNARGQTEAMIREQERKIKQTMAGLWGRR